MITIRKAFNWSPNGYDIETVPAGAHETLPERAVAIAEELGLIEEEPKKKSNKKARDK
ncbi:hypothetical protein [Endozoicomonas acroporae]|uniref:hypothetical protein n=1 Tax=Endozoicomonas acroporae TaxID=1701104 RepID=UPI0013D1F3FD|nr:hypothetical protein [Endozoicomonas acroporae]